LLTFGILTGKTHMFCSISLFRSFLFVMILLQNHCNLQHIHTFGASGAGETLTCAKMLLFTMFQAPFCSRRRPWGGLKCVTVVKLTFFKNVFSFFHHFKHPLFRAANLWKMRLSLVRGATFRILMPIFGPLWGGVSESVSMSKSFVLLKEFYVCFLQT
jgi:hypothetical protein